MDFQEYPRVGHLDCLDCMVLFLYQFRRAKLRYFVEKPEFSTAPDIPPLDWKYTLNDNSTEQLPLDAPKLLGKSVQLTTFHKVLTFLEQDANGLVPKRSRRHWRRQRMIQIFLHVEQLLNTLLPTDTIYAI